MRRVPRSFFARPVLEVGADLLGRRLQHGGVTVRVTETEAYAGLVDRDIRRSAARSGDPRARLND